MLKGHTKPICGIAWSPNGHWIASASKDRTVRIWNPFSASLRSVLKGHRHEVISVAWSPTGEYLATSGKDCQVLVWNINSESIDNHFSDHKRAVRALAWSPDGKNLASGDDDSSIVIWNIETSVRRWITYHTNWVRSLVWSADGTLLLSASDDGSILILDVQRGRPVKKLLGHTSWVHMAIWSPNEKLVASSSEDRTVRIWDVAKGSLLVILEAHSAPTCALSFSPDGNILVSKSEDHSVLVWDTKTWNVIQSIQETINTASTSLYASIAFSPDGNRLATLGNQDHIIRIWHTRAIARNNSRSSEYDTGRYVTAKLALLGDQQVGKTTLGYRLLTGAFKLFPRTHGQHFWVLPTLSEHRTEGIECHAVLWDFAGQLDYRLVHSLFLDNIHVAVVVFNAAEREDPLSGVRYWLSALARTSALHSTILVATQIDVGSLSMTDEQVREFCLQSNVDGGFVATSALTGEGVETLTDRLRQSINWDSIPTTVSTRAFSCTREVILEARADVRESGQVFIHSYDLAKILSRRWNLWAFKDAEVSTALTHLENHGLITLLPSSQGGTEILLVPELLINVAASITLRARSDKFGLAAIREGAIYSELTFPETDGISTIARQALLEAAVSLFLRRNLCFRETIGTDELLVFPALIHRQRVVSRDELIDGGPSYIVAGAIDQIFSVVVVMLRYTNIFSSIDYGNGIAEYVIGKDQVVGIKRSDRSDGTIRLALYFGRNTTPRNRQLFESLFETFLFEKATDVRKVPLLSCSNCGYLVGVDELDRRLALGRKNIFCPDCGTRVPLDYQKGQANQLSQDSSKMVTENRARAHGRTYFESALAYVRSFLRKSGRRQKSKCFLSYAWGKDDDERWVVLLADDLENAGITVILDRKDNATIGKNIGRFISDGILQCDFVAVVGTPLYGEKYQNLVATCGSVVAAEVDLIHQRLTGSEEKKKAFCP